MTDPAKQNQQLKARDSLGHGARQQMERLFEAWKMSDPKTKRKMLKLAPPAKKRFHLENSNIQVQLLLLVFFWVYY